MHMNQNHCFVVPPMDFPSQDHLCCCSYAHILDVKLPDTILSADQCGKWLLPVVLLRKIPGHLKTMICNQTVEEPTIGCLAFFLVQFQY